MNRSFKHLSAVWTNLLSRNAADKRARTEATHESNKRRKLQDGEEKIPIYATRFSKEEIDAEGRKPKKKVALMLGYSGSGYKGLQMYGFSTSLVDLASLSASTNRSQQQRREDHRRRLIQSVGGRRGCVKSQCRRS